MSRSDEERLEDVVSAVDAIRAHVARGTLDDDLIVDAVRMRLIEIGEAVKAISDELLVSEPTIPWKQIARMRDHIAHRYFLTLPEIIQETVDNDLGPLSAAVARLRDELAGRSGTADGESGAETPGTTD